MKEECTNCGITLRKNAVWGMCDVCVSMLVAVRVQSGLVQAQQVYENENTKLAQHKARLMGD